MVPSNGGTTNRTDRRVLLALFRIRVSMLKNTLAMKLGSSRLRVLLIGFFGLIFWITMFLFFYDGFEFLAYHNFLTAFPLMEMFFVLFFRALLVMLVFSTGIILYAGIFSSQEAQFLLAGPIPPDEIFAFEFSEALFFSSWGFLLLGSPLIVAYGISTGAPLYFYFLALAFFGVFVLVPGCMGAVVCLLVTNFLPHRRREILWGLTLMVLGAGIFYGIRIWRFSGGPVFSETWIENLIQGLRLSSLPLLPSQWIARGLTTAASNDPQGLWESLFYLGVLASNAALAYLITSTAYHFLYRRGYSRVCSAGISRRRRPSFWLPLFVDKLFVILPGRSRVLILKDVRTFVRDPLQWTQVLIFTALLGIYLANLGRMQYYSDSPYWRNMLGFLNLSVNGLLLAAFTSRFIFPQLSLEGQTIWVLGLCPISRDQVLWAKFGFSSGGAILVTLTLTLFGAGMLHMEPALVFLHCTTMLILCFGVSGIAVGLGARFPELGETDPSKIAAGFGGTLNLVVSLSFIMAVVLCQALPCHYYSITLALEQGMTATELGASLEAGISKAQFRFWLVVGLSSSVALGILTTLVSMRIGIRAFRNMEF